MVIVGQRGANVGEYRRAHGLELPILVDSDRSVIKRYGVYHRLGLTAVNIARPAVFIIDREQRIRYLSISKSQADRPDHATLMAALQQPRPPQLASPPPAADAPPIEFGPP